ncbi:hypothetical protein PB1_15224 [Bacillus methanolicus PB1]|uniref:Uncharacterized protein n=1 Tax=Bacillus methanolicus PB1 TaxID=997296 RepID=I3DXF0_BACMT|nr:hypothetical protein [Bacillus methanolicus]EIJ78921.1 hypothetical protein PB1_15224 [Bacillus methanolicus PB1]
METIIIAIVIGIISSIYNQFKNQSREQKKQSPAKPFTAGGLPYPKRQEATIHKENKRPESEKRKREPKDISDEIEAKYADQKRKVEEQVIALKKQQSVIEQKARQIRNSVENSHLSFSPAGKDNANELFTAEEANLLNGIIFSEILGPPRTKRPHSYKRR